MLLKHHCLCWCYAPAATLKINCKHDCDVNNNWKQLKSLINIQFFVLFHFSSFYSSLFLIGIGTNFRIRTRAKITPIIYPKKKKKGSFQSSNAKDKNLIFYLHAKQSLSEIFTGSVCKLLPAETFTKVFKKKKNLTTKRNKYLFYSTIYKTRRQTKNKKPN